MSEEEIKLIEEMKQNCIKQANYVDAKAMEKYNALRKLQQENQQLKEKLKDAELSREIASGHRKEVQNEELRQRHLKEKVEKQRDLYKSIMDEVKNKIKAERKISLAQSQPYTVSVLDSLLVIFEAVKE